MALLTQAQHKLFIYMVLDDFEPDTVNRVLAYLYLGDYPEDGLEKRRDSTTSSLVLEEQGSFDQSYDDSGELEYFLDPEFLGNCSFKCDKERITQAHEVDQLPENPLLLHVKVNAVAKHFNLTGLRSLTNRKTGEILEGRWNEVFDTFYGDAELPEITFAVSADRRKELVGIQDLQKLRAPGDFHDGVYSKLLHKSATRVKESHKTMPRIPRWNQYSDLLIKCQDSEFSVHKIVVCWQSDVFKELSEGNDEVSLVR
ncbi:hypothetical protein KEM56_002525 [Ascosphaera pollenicola]|nr:hypothetical protein KEM56_002525 [Ascosphaera pollenicola]